MYPFRRVSLLTAFLSLFMVIGAGAAAAQTEPDFGDPPETLIQGDDGEGIGRQIGEPQFTPASSGIDTTQFVIFGGVAVILTGLIGATVLTSRRRRSEIDAPTASALDTAAVAIRGTRTLQELTKVFAEQGHLLTGSTGALVTIDGIEGRSGDDVEISSDLVLRVNREQALARSRDMAAAPISSDGVVVGLVAIAGGNPVALTSLSQAASSAYARAAAQSSRFSSPSSAVADIDGLTGIGNRRRFDNDLQNVMSESDGEEAPVSLAMFDVDNFHHYNDAHGKQAGNEVLRSIAELIASNLRETDVVYRFSGVKFVALLPGASVDNAYVVVERIREAVENTDFEGEEVQPSGRVTISIGIAEAPARETGDLVEAADHALAQAKLDGRNRVVIEADIR